MILLAILLVCLEIPIRWFISPIVLTGILSSYFLNSKLAQYFENKQKNLPQLAILSLFILIGSFGYGRSEAEDLLIKKDSTAEITFSTNSKIKAKIIGKLGNHYFYLDDENFVNETKESNITYIKHSS
ncbi:hypothetical protein DSECCO2_405480 [anaerobic digester metagenome]